MNAGSPSGTPETRMPLERCDGRLLPRPHRGALRPSSAPRQQSSMEQPASEPSGSAEAAQGSDAPTTPEAADGAAAVDWRTDGSDFVGRRVYRTVTSEDGFLRRVEGVVVGWLSAAESDFFDACGAPAALYRVAYDGGELADDAEDLEEHEVRESLPTPDTDDVAVAPGDALPLPAAPKRPKPAAAPAPARQLSDYELLRERKVAENRAKLEALGFGAPAAAPKKPPKKKYKKHVFRDDSEFAAPPRRSAREAAVASRSPGAFRDGGLGTLEERRAAREAKARARADRERARDLAKARKDRAEVAKCLRALVRDVGRSAPVCKSNLQPDFNVRVLECFDRSTSAVLRELAESNRFVRKSAESTSI